MIIWRLFTDILLVIFNDCCFKIKQVVVSKPALGQYFVSDVLSLPIMFDIPLPPLFFSVSKRLL